MPHYKCPNCKKHYFSAVIRNATCKYCSGNYPLRRYLARKKDSAYVDECDMDGLLYKRPKRNVKRKFSTKQLQEFCVNNQQDLDDADWEPKARNFNLNMRLTESGKNNMIQRSVNNVVVIPLFKKSMTKRITKAAGRHTTGAVMGSHICGKGTISASKVSSGKKYSRGAKDYDEWCHLIGDALGGATIAKNLVAGSYSANTFMAVLEILLKGETALELNVWATCYKEHVAEFIYFQVQLVKDTNKNITFTIDAKCRYFTAKDMHEQQNILITWLTSVGIKNKKSGV
jgi:hypothetical protein